MKRNSNVPKRRSIRLREYDYSREGAYFITICTVNHSYILGNIETGEMNLSTIGYIVQDQWLRISKLHKRIEMDQHIIMPNHLHGIIVITEKKNSHCRGLINQTPIGWILMQNPAQTLGKIIRRFKAKASNDIHKGGFKDFGWQRNYYERVVRDNKELDKIRKYIINNPAKWELDRENPLSKNFMKGPKIYFKNIFEI